MAEKTIGQKLYEQMHPYDRDSPVNPSSWRDTSANLRASYEAAASAVWDEAMEACINRMRELAERADKIDDTEGAYMLRSVELNLESLKRNDKTEND